MFKLLSSVNGINKETHLNSFIILLTRITWSGYHTLLFLSYVNTNKLRSILLIIYSSIAMMKRHCLRS